MLVNAKLIYKTLRWICLLYLFPLGYIVLLLTYEGWLYRPEGDWKLVFAFSNKFTGVLVLLAFYWFLYANSLISRYVAEGIKWKRKLADNIPEDDPMVVRVHERVCKKLHLSAKRIKLNRNVTVNSPLAVGWLRKQILLPETDYTEDQLEMILYHELSHHKHHDLMFKTLAMIATLIHCFNPAAAYVFKMINHWSEYMADVSAMEIANGMSAKQYFDNIRRLIPGGKDELETSPFVSALDEDTEMLMRRVDFMRKYQKVKRAGKVVTALFAAVFAIMSVSTTYASARIAADVHSEVYKNLENLRDETEGLDLEVGKSYVAEDGTVVHYVPAEDLDLEGMQEVSIPEEDSVFFAAGVTYSFNWGVPDNTRRVTGEYTVNSGQVIGTSVTVTPMDKIFWLGVMDDDGNAWYVESRGTAAHNFRITRTNKYRVFVQNNYTDGTYLHAVGSFVYE